MLQRPSPILIADRFPALLDALLDLLTCLSPEEWQRPVHGTWTVKDLAQHLLGDEIGIVSARRDGFTGARFEVASLEALIALINDSNETWVRATRRLSPRLLCELLKMTGQAANACFAALDPFALGGPVDWAGPEPAPCWLDIAREFTERWHHQQHIRAAVGKPGCAEPYFLGPVLSAFVLALPAAYRRVEAPAGASVTLRILGPSGGAWTVVRGPEQWDLYLGQPEDPNALAQLPEDVAWRLFTKGIAKEQALAAAVLTGEPALALPLFDTVSILA